MINHNLETVKMLAVQKECWNLKKINLCSYTACTVGHLRPRLRGCVTRHFWFDERGAEANPAQVTSHHYCLHSPGFTRKQRKSEQLRRLCCSPSCSGVPVLSQTEDVCSVYPIPKDKTLSLLCHEKTDWQQAWMRHRREPGFIYLASIKSAWWQLWLKAIW